jgi:hypothetical protein
LWSVDGVAVEKRILQVKKMVRVVGKNLVQRTTKTAAEKRMIPLNAKEPCSI